MLMLDKTARNYIFAVLGFVGIVFAQPEAFTGGAVVSTPVPRAPASPSAKTASPKSASMVVLQGDSRGHFLTDVNANNQFINVLVDTGASMVALTAEDARKLGLSARDNRGIATVSTANGVVRVPLVRIPELRLQGLKVYDVEAAILPPSVRGHSLLGMSFLKRLGSFEMQGRTLVLRQ